MTKLKRIMTKKFERVLPYSTIEELWHTYDDFEDFACAIEQAVLTKRAEQQEPAAWLHEETGDVISSELKDYAPETLRGYDVPLYKCLDFSCQGKLDSSAQDESQDLYCCDCGSQALHYLVMDNVGYPNKTPICGRCTDEHEYMAREINEHEMRHFGGGYGPVSFHYEPLEVSNKNNHIADARKMVVPDGWQLVPIEPTEEMLVSGQEEWVLGKRGAMEDCEESKTIFKAMLAAAPKYTGESK